MATRTSDGRINVEEIGLSTQDLGTLLENVQSVLFGYTTLPVEVVLQESDVGLRRIGFREELRVGGDAHSRSLYLSTILPLSFAVFTETPGGETDFFDDTLLRADGIAILKLMLGEVDLGERVLGLNLVNCFLDLSLRSAHREAAARRSVVTGFREGSG